MQTVTQKYGPTYSALLRKKSMLKDDLKRATAGRELTRLSGPSQTRVSGIKRTLEGVEGLLKHVEQER